MSVPTQTIQSTAPAAETGKLLYPDGSQQATDSPPGAPASTPASDDVSRPEPTVDFFRDAFLRTRGIATNEVGQPQEATPAGDKQESNGAGAASPGSVQTSAAAPGAVDSPASSASPKSDSEGNILKMTPEEFDRRVQSETDRRIAKQNHEARARREKEEEDRLLNTNPYEYAERVKKKQAEQAEVAGIQENAHKATLSTMHAYDRSVVDPVVLALPEEKRNQLIASTGNMTGIPERGKLVESALAALREQSFSEGVAKARESLLTDPGFIKEVMTRYGGQMPEPEHIAAAGGPQTIDSPEGAMNDWIRGAANQVRGRGR